jgi:hypothetical protein
MAYPIEVRGQQVGMGFDFISNVATAIDSDFFLFFQSQLPVYKYV